VPGERVLGLDLGQARIGVSISDERGRLAVPFGTIHTGAPQDVKAIAKLVAEHGIGRIVLGLPLSLKGERGAAAAHAERFAEALRGFLEVPVELHDERLSTVEADRALRQTGAGGRQRRRTIDASAATVILQSWLDTHRRD
jgi:putative Holliday junction resolvase